MIWFQQAKCKFFFTWCSYHFNGWYVSIQSAKNGFQCVNLFFIINVLCRNNYVLVVLRFHKKKKKKWLCGWLFQELVKFFSSCFENVFWKKTFHLLPTKNLNHVKKFQSSPLKSVLCKNEQYNEERIETHFRRHCSCFSLTLKIVWSWTRDVFRAFIFPRCLWSY
jgi:hypothetical protein